MSHIASNATKPHIILPGDRRRAHGVAPSAIPGTETGLRITDLDNGTARLVGSRKGPSTLAVDGERTQTFEDLRHALASGRPTVNVEFIDAATGEVDTRTAAVIDTKIGVTVQNRPR